jgi:hypothetical protein
MLVLHNSSTVTILGKPIGIAGRRAMKVQMSWSSMYIIVHQERSDVSFFSM